jgi:hypothetical protein
MNKKLFAIAGAAAAALLISGCLNEPQQAENDEQSIDQTIAAVLPDTIEYEKMEDGNYLVEGDMRMSADQFSLLKNLKKNSLSKSSGEEVSSLFYHTYFKWDQTIKYYFDGTWSNADKNEFRMALRNMSNGNSLSFSEKSYKVDSYTVRVYNDPALSSSSWADVGKQSNPEVHFASNMMEYRTFYHEMYHVAGFLHEHQRPDRDSYVNVTATQNTSDPVNYAIPAYGTTYGSYDYASIMHYYDVSPVSPFTNDEWIGSFPTESFNDQKGLKEVYGEENKLQYKYRIKNQQTGRYACVSNTTRSIYSRSTIYSDLCDLKLNTGYTYMKNYRTSYYPRTDLYTITTKHVDYRNLPYYFKTDTSNDNLVMSVYVTPSIAPSWVPFGYNNGGKNAVLFWDKTADRCIAMTSSGDVKTNYLDYDGDSFDYNSTAEFNQCLWDVELVGSMYQ